VDLIRRHFPEEQLSRRSSRAQADPSAQGTGSGALDPQYRRPMAHASAVLPELQDGAPALSAVVRKRGDPCSADGSGELAMQLREQARSRSPNATSMRRSHRPRAPANAYAVPNDADVQFCIVRRGRAWRPGCRDRARHRCAGRTWRMAL